MLSCNNDTDPDIAHNYYFEGVYPDLTTGRELKLVYNGDTLIGKKVDVANKGKTQGILTFENVITGNPKTVLTVNLIESANPDNSEITRLIFEGIYSTQSRSIQYSGFIEQLLMFLELKEE